MSIRLPCLDIWQFDYVTTSRWSAIACNIQLVQNLPADTCCMTQPTYSMPGSRHRNGCMLRLLIVPCVAETMGIAAQVGVLITLLDDVCRVGGWPGSVLIQHLPPLVLDLWPATLPVPTMPDSA